MTGVEAHSQVAPEGGLALAAAETGEAQRDRHDGPDLQRERDEVQRLEDLLAVRRDDGALAREPLRQRRALYGFEQCVHHTARMMPQSRAVGRLPSA